MILPFRDTGKGLLDSSTDGTERGKNEGREGGKTGTRGMINSTPLHSTPPGQYGKLHYGAGYRQAAGGCRRIDCLARGLGDGRR